MTDHDHGAAIAAITRVLARAHDDGADDEVTARHILTALTGHGWHYVDGQVPPAGVTAAPPTEEFLAARAAIQPPTQTAGSGVVHRSPAGPGSNGQQPAGHDTRRHMFRTITVTLAGLAAIAATALGVTAASASTPGCAAAPGGFCGSQQVTPGSHLVLMMAATNTPGIGTKVEVKTASGTAEATGTNATEDFKAYNPPNPENNSKVFQYAPNGVVLTGKGFKGGLCVTATNDGAVRSSVVLWPCVNGTNQQWIYTTEAVNGTWRLRGSSYVLTDPNGGAAYTQLQIRNDWDGANQQWAAIYPPVG